MDTTILTELSVPGTANGASPQTETIVRKEFSEHGTANGAYPVLSERIVVHGAIPEIETLAPLSNPTLAQLGAAMLFPPGRSPCLWSP